MRRVHLRRRLTAAAGLVLLLVLTVAVVTEVGGEEASGSGAAQVETSAPPAPVIVAPKIRGVPADAPAPAPSALGAVLAPLVAAPGLGTLTGRIVDPKTGTVLWEAGPAKPQPPASTAKILTVAAALLTVGPDHVVQTTVRSSSVAGQIVLVGGGDPTLAGAATPHYPGAARLDDLVSQVRKSGVPVTSIAVDTSAYSGDLLAPGWHAADVGGGYTAPIEPMMIDGARSVPGEDDPPRSNTPALEVGQALATRLGVPEQTVSTAAATPEGRELAEVRSATLKVRAEQLLVDSDNVLAETVGREVAKARGLPQSFAGATEAVAATLREAGVDVSGLTMRDASGLSDLDRVPAGVLTDVLSQAAGDGPHAAALRPLLSMLPVAAASGTLADRFDRSATQGGAGWVRAKTGTLSAVNALAGIVTDVDGRVLVFALLSNGPGSGAARPALDAVAAALRTCGCR